VSENGVGYDNYYYSDGFKTRRYGKSRQKILKAISPAIVLSTRCRRDDNLNVS